MRRALLPQLSRAIRVNDARLTFNPPASVPRTRRCPRSRGAYLHTIYDRDEHSTAAAAAPTRAAAVVASAVGEAGATTDGVDS